MRKEHADVDNGFSKKENTLLPIVLGSMLTGVEFVHTDGSTGKDKADVGIALMLGR